jgi:hypothetical protein
VLRTREGAGEEEECRVAGVSGPGSGREWSGERERRVGPVGRAGARSGGPGARCAPGRPARGS